MLNCLMELLDNNQYKIKIYLLDPAVVSEVKTEEVTTNSIKVSWTEPTNTVVTSYKLTINPNDGSLTLPVEIAKYV